MFTRMSKVRNALLIIQNASMLRKVEIISIYKTSGSLPWCGGYRTSLHIEKPSSKAVKPRLARTTY